MKALFQALYDKAATPPSPFFTAIGGRLYVTEAPQNVVLPFAVVSLTSNVSDQLMEKCMVQLSIFSQAASSGEVCDLYTAATALYDNADIPGLGSFGNLGTERASAFLTKVEGVWHYVIEYEIWIVRK